MKITAFWDVTMAAIVLEEGIHSMFRIEAYSQFCLQDGGTKSLPNVGNDLPHYMMQYRNHWAKNM
jgi:hypothetical protein